jgi:transcriptional regulator with XRE-family HTH domain
MPERSLGRTIRYRRTKLGMSQAKLAELVGRSPTTIRSWESEKTMPNDTSVLAALSAILGVDEKLIFGKAGIEIPEEETSPTIEQALAELNPNPGESVISSLHLDLDDDFDDLRVEPIRPRVMVGEAEPADELDDTVAQPLHIDLREASYVYPPQPYLISPVQTSPVEPSYLEDGGQRQVYRIRVLATLVLLVALGIALLWAFSEGLDAFGSWWDGFFGQLRL